MKRVSSRIPGAVLGLAGCATALLLTRTWRRSSKRFKQRHARDNYRRCLDFYRLIVEHARDFALVTLDLEGRFSSWNVGAERVYGWKPWEIVGRSMAEIFTPEDRAVGIPRHELNLALQNGYASDERWHIRKDGSRFYFAGSVWPIYDEDGQLRGFAKVGTDLTARKHLEEQLAETKAELEQVVARRTAQLTETVHQLETFSYSLSHDMRAPLRATRNYHHIVKARAGLSLPPDLADLLDRADNAAKRMDELIRDVLTFYRTARESVQTYPVDTQEVVDQAVANWVGIDPDQVDVTVERPLLPVLGHEALLTQALSNLLGNAVRFVPPDRKAHVKVRTERRNGCVRLWVEDNGIGIAPQDQSAIWEMFRVLHPEKYGGTGMGLPIVKKAAERMGGEVGVESEPGQGSRFWLQLPAA